MNSMTKTFKTWLFAFFKIPMILYCRPQVISLNKRRCEVKIPLSYFTRNHVQSMYFGALSVGADLAGGLFLMQAIQDLKKDVSFIFKDFNADFIKRAMSDVHFICEEGSEVYDLVRQCIKSKKRENKKINIYATTPKISGDEPVAKFILTLSVKLKSSYKDH